MKFLLLSFLLLSQAFALTPFSLENLSSLNPKVLDKKKSLDPKFKELLEKKLQQKLESIGLKTKSNSFSNLLIKIDSTKVGERILCYISLVLVEDVVIQREKPTKAIAITYSKDDRFVTNFFEEDVLESIEFLLDDFATQYSEENEI